MKKKLLNWTAGTLLALLLVVATIVAVRAFDARRMPELEPWHRPGLESEFRARDLRPGLTFADYLAAEDRLFRELDERVYDRVVPSDELALSRYLAGGPNDPRGFPRDWNRSYELVPDRIRGGALLLHGLTDSPYSLRRVGRVLADEGFYVLGLRLPGHGTAPGALTSIRWEDWMAATRLAAAEVRRRVGNRGPLYVVGYSTGGPLAILLSLESLEDGTQPPDRLILFSPAIGVTPLAMLAGWHRSLSFLPYFEKFRWTSILPEYDPFKYNSFAKNGGYQVHLLTRLVQRKIAESDRRAGLGDLPPVLTFASLADSTVLTEATVEHLYDKLDETTSELVIFDVNREASIRLFFRSEPGRLMHRLETHAELPYRLTLIANAADASKAVVARSKPARSAEFVETPLGLEWPPQVYSLSHVALPFPPDDPIYGGRADGQPPYGIRLGTLEPRGEKDLLRVPVDQFMRLRYNPFFDYVERRIRELAISDSVGLQRVSDGQ